MKKIIVVLLMALAATILQKVPVSGNEFKQREAIIAQYKKWLDSLGPEGSKFWVRLDPRQRPHRLYLGEGFYRGRFHGTYPPNINEGTHLISVKGPTQFQVVPFVF
jgi:hypothetical protein